jgi:outer membrane protein assembly factor BamD
LVLLSCSPRIASVEPTAAERFSIAKENFDKKRYFDARQSLESLRFDYPGDSLMGEVQFYIALCYFHMKDYYIAEQEMRYFMRDYSEAHDLYDDTYYWLCMALFKQSLPARLDQAITNKTLEECANFAEQMPKSEYLPEIQKIQNECLEKLAEKEYLAGRQYRRMGYASSAIQYFRLFEQEFTSSKWVAATRYEWARSLYDQKNYSDALVMADSCMNYITRIEKDNNKEFQRTEPFSAAYKFFHLFGLIEYETRSELKIYIDTLKEDLAKLVNKINNKIKKS